MQGYADTFILVIPIENEPLRSPEHPFCWDSICSCHEDQELIQTVGQQVHDGLLTPDEANQFVAGKTL